MHYGFLSPPSNVDKYFTTRIYVDNKLSLSLSISYSLTHSLTRSLAHSLTHSLTQIITDCNTYIFFLEYSESAQEVFEKMK